MPPPFTLNLAHSVFSSAKWCIPFISGSPILPILLCRLYWIRLLGSLKASHKLQLIPRFIPRPMYYSNGTPRLVDMQRCWDTHFQDCGHSLRLYLLMSHAEDCETTFDCSKWAMVVCVCYAYHIVLCMLMSDIDWIHAKEWEIERQSNPIMKVLGSHGLLHNRVEVANWHQKVLMEPYGYRLLMIHLCVWGVSS